MANNILAEKSITLDAITRDYCVEVDGHFLGYAATYHAGEALADAYVYDQLTRVQRVASALATAAHDAGDTRNARALNKAAAHLANGVQPREVLPGEYLISSGTRDGIIHRVSTRRGCSCEAAQKGQACWHASAIEIITAAHPQPLARTA